MGLFINTPPVRVTIDAAAAGRSSCSSRSEPSRSTSARHEHTAARPTSRRSPRPAASSLFETIVVVNELHQGTRLEALGGPFEGRDFDLHDQTNFPLTLLAYLDPQVHFKLSYDRRRFAAPAIERVRELLVRARWRRSSTTPTSRSARCRGCRPAELATAARLERRAPRAPYPARRLRARAVRGAGRPHARRHRARPPRRAADLPRARRARQRASPPSCARSASGPTRMVGIFVERSIEMVVGLLGILKAGGAYVPMDPAYPARAHRDDARGLPRRRRADALAARPAPSHGVGRRRRARRASAAAGPRRGRVGAGLRSDQPRLRHLHVGSTGRPKGVMIEHRNVVNFFTAMDEQLGTPSPGVWLAVTSISFDISVLELFWTLARGFTVVVQDDEGRLVTDAAAPAARPRAPADGLQPLLLRRRRRRAASRDRYRLLLEGAKFADEHGFAAVWTPERHFHAFGGLYPNPARHQRRRRRRHRARRDPRRQRRAAAAQPDPRRRGVVGRRQPVERPRRAVVRLRLARQRLRARARELRATGAS